MVHSTTKWGYPKLVKGFQKLDDLLGEERAHLQVEEAVPLRVGVLHDVIPRPTPDVDQLHGQVRMRLVDAPLDVGENDADEDIPEAARAELLGRKEVVHTPRLPPRAQCLVAAKKQYIIS